MGWAASLLAVALVPATVFANPQRPADRSPTVFAVQATGTPSAEDFAPAPANALGDATFRLLWTASGFHALVSVADDDVVASITAGDDPGVAAEDSIEILVDGRLGEADGDAMTRVVVSAAGGVYDTRGVGAEEDAAIDRAIVTVDTVEGGWEALITIDAPSAMISPAGGAVLGFDFAVHDLDGTTLASEDWSGLTDVSEAACWSRVQLVGSGDPPADDDCVGTFERSGEACLEEGGGCAVGRRSRSEAGPIAGVLLALLAIRRASRRPVGWPRRRSR